MGGLRELRGRIRSVGNIKQITRAMEMVATTKLRRFQDRAVASRPYAREVAGLVGRLAEVLGDDVADQPLFRAGERRGTLALVVTSDRGLCGPYNSNLLRVVELWLRERTETDPVTWFVIGRKGFQYLRKTGREVARFLVEPPLEQMDFRGAAHVSKLLVEAFLQEGHRDVQVFHTAFESMVRFVPRRVQLLPIRPDAMPEGATDGGPGAADVILEPDPVTIFERVVPRYVETLVYNALMESVTSEYASRRFSMKNATDAANEMQGVLKGQFNRLRQESITTELLDIVGGAEALR